MDDATEHAPAAPLTQPATFDVSSMAVAPDATNHVDLLNRNGDDLIGANGKQARIIFHPPGSKVFTEAKTRAKNRTVRRLRAKGAKADSKSDEDLAHEGAFLRDITIAWENFNYSPGGATYADPKAMFYACYIDPGMGWLTDQLNSEAGDWGNDGASSTQS